MGALLPPARTRLPARCHTHGRTHLVSHTRMCTRCHRHAQDAAHAQDDDDGDDSIHNDPKPIFIGINPFIPVPWGFASPSWDGVSDCRPESWPSKQNPGLTRGLAISRQSPAPAWAQEPCKQTCKFPQRLTHLTHAGWSDVQILSTSGTSYT